MYINCLSQILNLIIRPTQQIDVSFSLSNNEVPLPHSGRESRIPHSVSAMICSSSSTANCLVCQSEPFCCLPFCSTHHSTTYCSPQNGAQFLYGVSPSKVYCVSKIMFIVTPAGMWEQLALNIYKR
jgi:hypothetical protein